MASRLVLLSGGQLRVFEWQVYTLGPQPSSSIERNHLMNYHGGQRTDRKGNRQDPNAMCESQHSCSALAKLSHGFMLLGCM